MGVDRADEKINSDLPAAFQFTLSIFSGRKEKASDVGFVET